MQYCFINVMLCNSMRVHIYLDVKLIVNLAILKEHTILS